MKSFPTLSIIESEEIYNKIVLLYNNDQSKLIEAAVFATQSDHTPFIMDTGRAIINQVQEVKQRVRRSTNNYGRNLLIKWLETLNEGLLSTGANGVTQLAFIERVKFISQLGCSLNLNESNQWELSWEINLSAYPDKIHLLIRDKRISEDDIIPHYIIQYVIQSIISFNQKNYLTALAIISIALEGTLRDALCQKGYTYSNNDRLHNSYETIEMEVSKNPLNSNFVVSFPSLQPQKIFSEFLSEPDKGNSDKVRIKRFDKDGEWFLEIRKAHYLKDYWSSNTINIPSTGRAKISGLGTALAVARNTERILDGAILPTDTDEVIKCVRNNLIHLSGDALSTIMPPYGETLGNFVLDENKVYDLLRSICNTIDDLYLKIKNNTL